MIGYAEYVKKARTESPAGETESGIEDSVLLTEGPGGLPLLPVAVKGVRGEETSKLAGKLVREYFLQHYSSFSGITEGHVLIVQQEWQQATKVPILHGKAWDRNLQNLWT